MWFALPHTDSARELGKQPKYGLNISFDILSIFFFKRNPWKKIDAVLSHCEAGQQLPLHCLGSQPFATGVEQD